MPYRRVGSKIYHQKGGSWKVKQKCGSAEKAKGALRLLQGLEHGSIRPQDVGKPKKVRSKKSARKRK